MSVDRNVPAEIEIINIATKRIWIEVPWQEIGVESSLIHDRIWSVTLLPAALIRKLAASTAGVLPRALRNGRNTVCMVSSLPQCVVSYLIIASMLVRCQYIAFLHTHPNQPHE